jgi:hypothetical protein
MRTSLMVRTLIDMLALEWELCGEDPAVFCYRISVSLRGLSEAKRAGAADELTNMGAGCGGSVPEHGCGVLNQGSQSTPTLIHD